MTLIHDFFTVEYEKEMVARDQTFPAHFQDYAKGVEPEVEEDETKEQQFTEA